MLPRSTIVPDAGRASAARTRRTLRPALACAAALLVAACGSDRNRPGFDPGPAGGDDGIVSIVVFGTLSLPGTGAPVPGALMRTEIRRGDCDGAVMMRGPETITDAAGAYRLEVDIEADPFTGCVRLEIDFNTDTILPDTTVLVPGIQVRRTRDNLRVDVTYLSPRAGGSAERVDRP